MRVEDVGSLSPSGDLLAFIMAIIITVGVLSTFTDFNDSSDDDPDPVFIMNYLVSSDLLDEDDNNILEFPETEKIDTIFLSGLEDLNIMVLLEEPTRSMKFFVLKGKPVQNSTFVMERTLTNSWLIVLENGEGITPGRISISLLKEEWE